MTCSPITSYSFSTYGKWNGGRIKVDWGVPLCFPYIGYEEMASALLRRQGRDESFRVSAEVNRAVFNAIDAGYVRRRHCLELDEEVIARTLANIADALCLVFFAAKERDIARRASLVFASETLAALFQEAWFSHGLLELVGCWSYLSEFTRLHPGRDKYCFEQTRTVPDGYHDVFGMGGCSSLHHDATRRICGC